MSKSKLNAMVAKGVTGSFEAGSSKRRFHNEARKHLRKVAMKLALAKGDYDIRSNKGGPAVSGEITLHSDSLYIQVSDSVVGPPDAATILVRRCKSRKDYTGEQNNFCPAEVLESPDEMIEWLSRRGLITYDEDKYGRGGMDRNFRPARR